MKTYILSIVIDSEGYDDIGNNIEFYVPESVPPLQVLAIVREYEREYQEHRERMTAKGYELGALIDPGQSPVFGPNYDAYLEWIGANPLPAWAWTRIQAWLKEQGATEVVPDVFIVKPWSEEWELHHGD